MRACGAIYRLCGTFKVQVLGSVNILGDRLRVHLERVRVGDVPCDDHVMPLVIIQWVVAVPLQQAGSIPQVEHIVDKPGQEEAREQRVKVRLCMFFFCECVFVCVCFIFPLYLPRLSQSLHIALTPMGRKLTKIIFAASQWCLCFYKFTKRSSRDSESVAGRHC